MNEKTFDFNGQEIRVFERDGNVWMYANDIGKALGFKRGVKSIVLRLGIENVNELPVKDVRGSIQPAYVLHEGNVKDLVSKVDPEEAAPFVLWYAENLAPYIEAGRSRITSADSKMRMLETKNKHFYTDFIREHKIYLTTAEIASDYNKSERWMTKVLLKLGFLTRSKKGNITVNNAKYPSPKYWLKWEDDGVRCDKWSSNGVMAIKEALDELGYKTKYEI